MKNKQCKECRAPGCGAVCPHYVEEMRIHFSESEAQAALDDALDDAIADAGYNPEDYNE